MIVTRLHTELVKILNSLEIRDRLIAEGADVETTTPEELMAFVRTEIPKWAKAVKDSGGSWISLSRHRNRIVAHRQVASRENHAIDAPATAQRIRQTAAAQILSLHEGTIYAKLTL